MRNVHSFATAGGGVAGRVGGGVTSAASQNAPGGQGGGVESADGAAGAVEGPLAAVAAPWAKAPVECVSAKPRTTSSARFMPLLMWIEGSRGAHSNKVPCMLRAPNA